MSANKIECLIVVHPPGSVDEVGTGNTYWTEVPMLPQCSMVEAARPEQAVEDTISKIEGWTNNRRQGEWNPVGGEISFTVDHAF